MVRGEGNVLTEGNLRWLQILTQCATGFSHRALARNDSQRRLRSLPTYSTLTWKIPFRPETRSKRKNAFVRLSDTTQQNIQIALRINSLVTRAGLDDITDLLDSSVDPVFLVLPKVEAASDLITVDRLLTASSKRCGLIALIETARAVASLQSIVTVTPRLRGLTLGAADLAADLGSATEWDALAYSRGALIAAAGTAAIVTIDSLFFDTMTRTGCVAKQIVP